MSGKRILYSVVDEYETEFEVSPKSSKEPLTLGRLVEAVSPPRPTFRRLAANSFLSFTVVYRWDSLRRKDNQPITIRSRHISSSLGFNIKQ